MNKIPNCLKKKICLDSIILLRNQKWKKIHDEILLLQNKPIKSVISIQNILYRYELRFYIQKDFKIILPKLNENEKFYSFSYISRIMNNSIQWNKLPWLQNINITDLYF